MEVVPVEFVFVADELDDELLELLEVGFVCVLDGVVLLDDELDEELLVECVVLVLEQSLAASSLTVAAPCPRFLIRVVLTLFGSEPISFESCCAAAVAAPQLRAATADEIEFSWSLRLLA